MSKFLLFFNLVLLGCASCSEPPFDTSAAPLYGDHFPAPRPNSNLVAFSRIPTSEAPATLPIGLFIVDTNTNQEKQLFGDVVGRPSWLDMNKIVFPAGALGQGVLMVYNFESSSTEKIGDGIVKDPIVKAFGSKVVFEYGSRIFVKDIHSIQVSTISSVGFFNPTWSTNNTIIASMNTDSGSARILVEITLDGTVINEYTNSQYHHIHSYPSISKTNDTIAFELIRPDDEGHIVHWVSIYNVNNEVIYNVHKGQYPMFDNNDQYIYFSGYPSNYDSGLRVHRYNIGHNRVEQITF